MPSGNRNGSRAVVEMKELRGEGQGQFGVGWDGGIAFIHIASGDGGSRAVVETKKTARVGSEKQGRLGVGWNGGKCVFTCYGYL